MTLDGAAALAVLSRDEALSTRAVAVRAGFGVAQMKACDRELSWLERKARLVESRVVRVGQVRKRFWRLSVRKTE